VSASIRRAGAAAGGVIAIAIAAGCTSAPTVRRAYPGTTIDGRYIEPEAYAAVLRGSMAETHGDPAHALASYERALSLDPRGPEIWTRVASVRCALDPRDRGADEALRRALAADADYAPAWEVEARCASSRGDVRLANRAAARAWALVSARTAGRETADERVTQTLLATANEVAAREAVVRLTFDGSGSPSPSAALVAWAREHDEIALWARALELRAAVFTEARQDAARAAGELAGLGRSDEASAVAAAMAEAGDLPLDGSGCELAKRLALDEAIARSDDGAAGRRASRMRIGLEEVAARWLLRGDRERARAVARSVADADPGAAGAGLVLDAVNDSPAARRAHPVGAAVTAAAWLVWGNAWVARTSPVVARAALAAVPHASIVEGDAPVERLAVDLAARGVIADDALSPGALVELRALRWASPQARAGEPSAVAFSEARTRAGTPTLDPRHEYLALTLDHPGSPAARELGARLLRLAPHDRIVLAAQAIDLLGQGAPVDPAMPGRLGTLASHDALLAAIAYRLALRVNDRSSASGSGGVGSAFGGGGTVPKQPQ
jgi:tetratricopeptide (TPR) repeat protein